MKKIAILMLSLCLLFAAVSCGKSVYRDDLAVSSLANHVMESLAKTDGYVVREKGLDSYFTTPEYVTEFAIRHAQDTNNIDEIGIWHVTDGNADAMKALLSGYLKESLEKNETFYNSYIPEETPKLRDAEVRVFGNYVAYAILSASDRSAFFSALETELSAD